MHIDLQGKRALVTGGSSGIGKAIALALGGAGASVAVDYVSDGQAADEVVAQLEKMGVETFAVQADVSDVQQVASMFERIDSAWGGLDVLVNNAAIQGQRTPSWEIDPDDWKKAVDVNLFGSFLCSRQALKRMIPSGSGVILNITSVHERIPWSGFSAYTASKAGLAMLTQSLAQEAAPHGVRVAALAPGAIKTPINQEVWQDPERLEQLRDKIPMDRVGEPEEVARMALVLVSDAASYLTGSTVFVDGGMITYASFAEGG